MNTLKVDYPFNIIKTMSEEKSQNGIKVSADKVEINREIIAELLPQHLEEVMKNKYDSPIRDALKEMIRNEEGEIKKLVKEVMSEIINDSEFKQNLKEEALSKIIKSAFSR